MEHTDLKPNMTDEERLALAEKLDKELDEYIDGLERKPYTDGWDPANWREEIDKHPFFMKETPKPGDDLHPLYEGLQQLKYDPMENTCEELAQKYKEDGTFYMQHKKFRMAILSYTEGIQIKDHNNEELKANLFNNRSVAQFYIKNYRSSMIDAKKAIELKADYTKPKVRVVKCLIEVKKYKEAIGHLEDYLIDEPCNKELIDLQKLAITKKTEIERYERKLLQDERKMQIQFQNTIDALIQRKVKFEEVADGNLRKLTPELIKPRLEPLEYFTVKLAEDGVVYWPVIFCYPEFQLTDLQQQMSELISIHDCLDEMLSTPLDSDRDGKYQSAKDLCVYFENRVHAKIHQIDYRKPLKEIVSNKDFNVFDGYLTFFVLPSNTTEEKKFLHQKRIPIVPKQF